MDIIHAIRDKIEYAGFDIIKALLIFVLGYFIVSYGSRFFQRLGQKYHSEYFGMIASKMTYYAGWFFVILIVLDKLGFNTTQLLGAAGIIGVAVGFASQQSLSNIISGIFLIAEKPFVVGDKIQVDTIQGKIVSIDLLSIKLIDADNDYIRIPNEYLLKNTFVNLTRYPIKKISILVPLDHDQSALQILKVLQEVLTTNQFNQQRDAIETIVTGFDESALRIRCSMWVATRDVEAAKSSLFVEIKKVFEEKNIKMPSQYITIRQVQ